ncbi:hypothetical protein, partial [Gracilimonas sp.]|uniref:hypothetical protein n=1 Tax=Gracilimonas sp. TaxID=1974203 RepID=UPI002870DB9B|nr:hypothetical protein [Gracilimonas sp.]
MENQRFESLTFYERTIETILFNIDKFGGSELKLLLLINRLTVGADLNAAEIRLKDFEEMTGLSRKTVIKALDKLEKLKLIKWSKRVLDARSLNDAGLWMDFLKKHPEVIERTKTNLKEKIQSEQSGVRKELQEWYRLLESMSFQRLKKFMQSDS